MRDTEPQWPHVPLTAVISRPYSSNSGPPIAFPSSASIITSPGRAEAALRGISRRGLPAARWEKPMTTNPALAQLEFLVGAWDMELSEAAFLPAPDAKVHGSVTFEWI